MARGRHRHASLHRVAVPAGVGGFAVLCAATALFAGGAPTWLLRLLVVLAALAAVTGAFLLRVWDSEAGRRVAKERAATAALSWRMDERQAELEEAQELVASLEEKVRAKRTELGRLRGEHAALLRRYARAENDRAHALEGRRRLALEAARPTPALEERAGATADPAAEETASGAGEPGPELYHRALSALNSLAPRTVAAAPVRHGGADDTGKPEGAEKPDGAGKVGGAEKPGGAEKIGGAAGPARGRSRGGSRPGGFDFFGATGRPRRIPGAPTSAPSASPVDPADHAALAGTDTAPSAPGAGVETPANESGGTGGEAEATKADAEKPAESGGEDRPGGNTGEGGESVTTVAEEPVTDPVDTPAADPTRNPGPTTA
ncbi:hypothetical protein [Streptomyces sp. ST2-7A]|uniref:hypothetical protein n=1 Tax=Streptomyces sp. ST2-7A TaxID=2907214 RepID=UPI001F2C89F2|nr:hypothetical protein [Streptomyces sp. ST2-7A]MCE7083174.1 hypothetical protein [Streptomyces sp. ST2-7A]